MILVDNKLGWALNPEMNPSSNGFNEMSINFSSLNNSILAIGDSFAYGVVGYEDNYITLLEKEINVSVVNLGVSGYNIPQYGKMIEQYANNAEGVILNLFVGNDFSGSNDNVLVINGQVQIINPLLVSTLGRSYLGRGIIEIFYMSNSRGIRVNAARNFYGVTKIKKISPMEKESYINIEHERMMIAKRNISGHVKTMFNKNLDELNKIIDYCKAKNIPLIVIIIPDEFQVDDALQEVIMSQFNASLSEYDLDLPQKVIMNYLDRNNVSYINLLSSFQENSTSFYEEYNSHWNVEGNHLAATAIASRLRKGISGFPLEMLSS